VNGGVSNRLGSWLLAASSLVAGAGCIDDLTAPSFIERPRVLGAAAEVLERPGEAFAMPGETVRFEWLFVTPSRPVPLGYAVVACPGIVVPTGDRLCAGPPIGLFEGDASTDAPPAFEVMVPTPFTADEILLLGIFCADGRPILDLASMSASCEGDAAIAERVTFGVGVDVGDGANRLPAPPVIGFPELEAWEPPPSPLPLEGCADRTSTGLPSVVAGTGEVELVVESAPDDREVYVRADGSERRETLTYSHAATAGELARFFSVSDDRTPTVSVGWTPPAESSSAAGEVIKLYFIVRDGRAGVAWTERALCLVDGR
jgi:hypothetical protein